MTALTLTFDDLIREMRDRAGRASYPARSSLPNLESALRQFAEERGLRLEDAVGSTLRLGFYRARDAHTETLRDRKADSRVIANRRSALKLWRALVTRIDAEGSGQKDALPPFAAALKLLFEKARTEGGARNVVKKAAAECGVPIATIGRWMSGARPTGKCVTRHVKNIERYFALEPGTLLGLLLDASRETDLTANAPSVSHRKLLRDSTRNPYCLKPDKVTPDFRKQWESLIEHKTQLISAAETDFTGDDSAGMSRKVWVLHALGSARAKSNSWIDSRSGRHCPSAGMAFSQVSSFLGWLALSTEKGGCGLDYQRCQSLAFLTEINLLANYLKWRIDRSDGVINAAIDRMLMMVGMLTHPKTGYLRRIGHIADSVGIRTEVEWLQRCDAAFAWVRATKKKIAPKLRMSRDPFEPIRVILALANPLAAVADAIQRMRASRICTGGAWEAKWHRDILLLMLLASNPIRARNLRELTYRQDNTGDLRQDTDGSWRIVIPRARLKNADGAAREADYSCRIQEQVWPHIERYLKEHRMLLLGSQYEYVFPNPAGTNRPWESFNRHFFALTKRLFPNTPGFGPHAMRHIVATAILKQSGSILRAAKALHDRPATVQKHYAQFLNDDVADWMSEAFAKDFKRF